MKRVKILFLMLALVAPLAAKAQDEGATGQKRKRGAPARRQSLHDEFTGQGYGVAGCGLGSVVFGAKPGLIQIVAATLNGTFANQTFAITTGTLNCDLSQSGQQAAMFIEVNRQVLAKEAARGQGETVTGLATLLNCDNSVVFGHGLQQNFEQIFDASKNSYDATRQIFKAIQSNPALKASCQIQG